MGFEVIPAVDVTGGRLARLGPDGPVPLQSFGGDPLVAAAAFAEAGASWIHVVDMDLAFTGEARNLEVIRAIAELPVRVQASGGLSSRPEVEAVLAAGARRAVVGSGALVDRKRAEGLVAWFGDRLAVGIEIEGDRIRSRGRPHADLPLRATLTWLVDAAVARFVVTDVAAVGSLRGPDVRGVAAVAATGRPVVASGGVTTLDHLRALAAIDGVEGAIVGRALHDGGMDLRDALAAVSAR